MGQRRRQDWVLLQLPNAYKKQDRQASKRLSAGVSSPLSSNRPREEGGPKLAPEPDYQLEVTLGRTGLRPRVWISGLGDCSVPGAQGKRPGTQVPALRFLVTGPGKGRGGRRGRQAGASGDPGTTPPHPLLGYSEKPSSSLRLRKLRFCKEHLSQTRKLSGKVLLQAAR